ncbi:MAG: PDZ domain-containing protein [Saprospiraceae bacterium]|nr:trypsin-like peptidase domain-containing protein [Bacteroidia bacterium]NNE15990.1 PDZ domain-containing protein [Saprospiraceae bacterium]NNL93220.1 PDZ domain-containing protein [Saprospiraceae bacterium]
MKETIRIVLIASVISMTLLFCYHLWHKETIIEIEDNYGKLVARAENSALRTKTFNPSSIPNDFVEPANMAKNAVVAIKAIQIKGNSYRKRKYKKTNGSGVILSSNGYIVTNYHVIEDADNIEALLENNREYNCKMVGYDQSTDLALLKINEEGLEYLEFGDSNLLQVGEWVLAVGNPFKLQSSVTAGIVSAKARNINIFNKQGIESFIQTDAAINQGNSGGALINTDGQLIGINTALLTVSGNYEGFSFAVPSSIVKKVVDDLREYGAVQRAWLGVGVLDINEKKANNLGLPFVGGTLVDLVEMEGAGKEAGLQSDDVILSINGKETMTRPQFLELISQHRPGDEILIEYFRKGKRKNTIATLKNQLNTTDYIAVRKDKVLVDVGFTLRDLDSKEKKRLSSDGALVVAILKDSKISRTNMDQDYIITSINNESVKNVDDVVNVLNSSDGRIEVKGFYEMWPGDYPYVFDLD